MTKKREQWRLPKTFIPNKEVNGSITRHDGEPTFLELTKHGNDHTLSANNYVECCDCGLTHLKTYNVLKTPDGEWCLVRRAYRIPGTGRKE